MSEGFNMGGFISESNPEVIALGNQISDLRSQLRRERKENILLRSTTQILCGGFHANLNKLLEIQAIEIKMRWNLTLMTIAFLIFSVVTAGSSPLLMVFSFLPIGVLSIERLRLGRLMDFVILETLQSSHSIAETANAALKSQVEPSKSNG